MAYESYEWHVCKDADLTRKAEWHNLPSSVRGVLMTCRCQASQARRDHGYTDGTLAYGSVKRMKMKDLVEFVSSTIPDLSPKTAGSACTRLLKAGFLERTRAGVVKIAGWASEQDIRSAGAKRKQRHDYRCYCRTALAALHEHGQCEWLRTELSGFVASVTHRRRDVAAVVVDMLLEEGHLLPASSGRLLLQTDDVANDDRTSLPPCPPSDSDSEPSRAEPLHVTDGAVTCNDRGRSKKEDEYLPNSISMGGQGGREVLSSAPVDQQAIFSDPDPIDVAMRYFGVSDDMNRNVWRKYLRDLQSARGLEDGERCFRDALNETRTDKISGRPGGNWVRIFTSKLKKSLADTPQRAIA